jgi:hypothetical protein
MYKDTDVIVIARSDDRDIRIMMVMINTSKRTDWNGLRQKRKREGRRQRDMADVESGMLLLMT